MKSENLFLAAAIAVSVGIVQTMLLLVAWDFIAARSAFPLWLYSHGLRGDAWRAVLTIQDWIMNISLCLPAAYILCALRPRKLFVYLILAIVPGFLWQYRLVFTEPDAFGNFMAFFPGVLSAIGMLPAATVIVYLARRHKNVELSVQGERRR